MGLTVGFERFKKKGGNLLPATGIKERLLGHPLRSLVAVPKMLSPSRR